MMPFRRGLCQPALERLELGAELGRQPVPEPCEVRADLLELLAHAVLVDAQQLLELLAREVEPVGLEIVGSRDVADDGLLRADHAVETAEDPGEHA